MTEIPRPTALGARFAAAEPLASFIDRAQKYRDLWLAVARRAAIPADVAERAASLTGRWHLLVLVEDWCGDAVNTVPVLQAVADAAPHVSLRVLERDRNPDLMDTHLTNGARSIPLAILFDAEFNERGQWGPRPTPLQGWVMREGLALPKDERYKQVRTWYARDRGATTARELLALLERAATAVGPEASLPMRSSPRIIESWNPRPVPSSASDIA